MARCYLGFANRMVLGFKVGFKVGRLVKRLRRWDVEDGAYVVEKQENTLLPFDALSALVEQSRASSNYDRRLKVQRATAINHQVAVT